MNGEIIRIDVPYRLGYRDDIRVVLDANITDSTWWKKATFWNGVLEVTATGTINGTDTDSKQFSGFGSEIGPEWNLSFDLGEMGFGEVTVTARLYGQNSATNPWSTELVTTRQWTIRQEHGTTPFAEPPYTTVSVAAPSRANPNEDLTLRVTVKNITTIVAQCRLNVYAEQYEAPFPSPRRITQKVFELQSGVTKTFNVPYKMPSSYSVSISAFVETVGTTGVYSEDSNDTGNVILIEEQYEPPVGDPCEGYSPHCVGYDWYYCENGEIKVERNSAHCGYIPPEEQLPTEGTWGCGAPWASASTTKWWVEGGMLYFERNSPDCGGSAPTGDGEAPLEGQELLSSIMKYTAIGGVVFAVTMLLLPSRKKGNSSESS